MPSIKKKIHKTSERRLFYKSRIWYWIRRQHLKDEPVCRRCGTKGRTTYKRLVVDHILPRRLFEIYELSKENLCTLCHDCHTYKTKYDSSHHWAHDWLRNVRLLDYYQAIKDNISILIGKE